MIGDMVVKTSISGTRLILIRLRFAMMAPSASASAIELINSLLPLALVPFVRSGGLLFGGVTGQRQEHVVQGGSPQADVEHLDAALLELQHDGAERIDAAGDRQP